MRCRRLPRIEAARCAPLKEPSPLSPTFRPAVLLTHAALSASLPVRRRCRPSSKLAPDTRHDALSRPNCPLYPHLSFCSQSLRKGVTFTPYPYLLTVRILVISDIHGNIEALEACLAAVSHYDRVFNLGDIVGYGASPNEVVARSRELGGIFVRGNHDKACSGISNTDDFNHIAALAAYWTKQKLTPENLEWVKALPHGPIKPDKISDVQCVHGSPLDEDEYIIVVRDAYEPMTGTSASLTFFGHTHIQGGFAVDGEEWLTLRPVYETDEQTTTFEFQLKPNAKYLINPGSVGQPRDGDWRAACAVFDTSDYKIIFHRVVYDVAGAQKRIYDAGLPDRLAIRLKDGR